MQNAIEESIVREFHKSIWLKLIKGIKTYDLIQDGDRIAVGISGEKTSMLMALSMKRLQKYGRYAFELTEIPITEHLYQKAQEAGCNKIAVADHFDDVIETILTGVLYAGEIRNIMPKEHIQGMQIIRPMYLIRESDVTAWKDMHHLNCSERASEHQEVRELLTQLRKISPAIDKNIFRSMENVNLKTLISYDQGDAYHHFLDDFDQNITNHGTKSGEGRKEKKIC